MNAIQQNEMVRLAGWQQGFVAPSYHRTINFLLDLNEVLPGWTDPEMEDRPFLLSILQAEYGRPSLICFGWQGSPPWNQITFHVGQRVMLIGIRRSKSRKAARLVGNFLRGCGVSFTAETEGLLPNGKQKPRPLVPWYEPGSNFVRLKIEDRDHQYYAAKCALQPVRTATD